VDESSFERLLNIQSYSDEELKALLTRLEEDEREISKRRRILHAELDIVRAELVRRLRDQGRGGGLVVGGNVSTLAQILARRPPKPQEDKVSKQEDSSDRDCSEVDFPGQE